ncbi:IS200/IS605 family transposase [Neobacillus cucumis]|uniref:IS200/IS605 family transposase n=1 Tax=Neobacillus cucumis TaxID=1740721 RepID=UPI00285307F0|nr:IS200/IS605 family transposase [Neobacillus cucumis]MDR4950459.1 IS200/IS605 family transposase [Neobacillus cucumis]
MYDIHSNKYHVSCLQYHITFYTYNDIPLEKKEIDFIKSYFKIVSSRHEFKIVGIEIQGFSVTLVINCKTTHYIPNIMKALKGGSARFLYKKFPEAKEKSGGNLWAQKYYIATDNRQLDIMVKDY